MTNQFDPHWAEGIVRRAVNRKLHLFSAWPEMEVEDLVQEGVIAAMRAHKTFNPSKAKYTTWIYRAVSCRLIDLWRVRGRRADRELTQAKPGWIIGNEPGGHAEWLGNVYRALKARLEGYGVSQRLGRPALLTAAQATALDLLRGRMNLGVRKFAIQLRTHPEWLAAVEMTTQAPNWRTIYRSGKSVSKVKNYFLGSEKVGVE